MNEKIVSEIVDKVNDYENNMQTFFEEYNSVSDYFTLKKKKNSDSYSRTPNAEIHKAVMTTAAFMYRGLTSKEPFFEAIPMDVIGVADNSLLLKIESTIETQLKLSRYKQNLWQTCASASLFGTAVIQEPFYDIPLGNFGRRMPITGFEPRSLLTTYFDRNAQSVNSSDWVVNVDLVSIAFVSNLAKSDPEGNRYNKKAISNLIADSEPMDWNEEVRTRLSTAGYTDTQMARFREVITYSGKLDTLNDGKEYICMLGNRQELLCYYENPSKCNMRPFKITRFIPWELELMGYGIGLLFGSLQKSINNNRKNLADVVAMSTMGMYILEKFGGLTTSQLGYAQRKILEADSLQPITPFPVDYNGINSGMSFEQKLIEEIRAGTGATDTLQAAITDASATEVSLAQNAAVRNMNVRTELFAEDIVKPHIEYMHDNNTRNLHYPFVVNVKGTPTMIYPNDMQTDVDFKIRIVSDKDFKNLTPLFQTMQMLTSTKSNLPPEFQQKIAPLIEIGLKSLLKSVDIDVDSIPDSGTKYNLPMGQDLAMSGVMNGFNSGLTGNVQGAQNDVAMLQASA